MLDFVINNGTIIDGTNNRPFKKNIGIKNGKIAVISNNILSGIKTIDIRGLYISPGFIDCHSHCDLNPLLKEEYKKSRLMQGITTELVGQCGISLYPITDKYKKKWEEYTKSLLGNINNKYKFYNLADYINIISKKMKNNMIFLIGQGALRNSVNGLNSNSLNKKQLIKMCKLYEESLQEGAFGISLGLSYLPGIYARHEELLLLAKITKKYNRIMMAHIKSYGKKMFEAIDEYIKLSIETGVKVHISHCRSYKNKKYGIDGKDILKKINNYRKYNNLNITLDQHPYTSGSTFLNQLLPPKFRNKNKNEFKSILKNKNQIKEINQLVLSDYPIDGWDNIVKIVGWKNIFIPFKLKNKKNCYKTKSILDISKENKLKPIEVVLSILLEQKETFSIIIKNMFSEKDIFCLLKDNLTYVCSDGIPSGFPHPRLYGAFTHFIANFVNDKKILSLEEAIYKITMGPASLLGIDNIKGKIKENYDADLNIFNLSKIQKFEKYFCLNKKQTGIEKVYIKGNLVYENKKTTYSNKNEFKGEFIKYNI